MERIKKSFQKAMGKGEALLAALEACTYVRAALFLDDFDFMIS